MSLQTELISDVKIVRWRPSPFWYWQNPQGWWTHRIAVVHTVQCIAPCSKNCQKMFKKQWEPCILYNMHPSIQITQVKYVKFKINTARQHRVDLHIVT